MRTTVFPLTSGNLELRGSVGSLVCEPEVGGEQIELNLHELHCLFGRYCWHCLCGCFSLSEYADENMMDGLNLAICFGPTLMPTPADRDQVQFQGAVNEVVKTIILCHDRCFCRDDVPGKKYDKFQADFEEA